MSPARRSMRPATSAGIRSRATSSRLADRSTPTTSAPRRASATQTSPGPQPASSTRIPVRSSGSRESSSSRISARPARTVARMRLTGASEVSRSQVAAAVRSK